MSTLLILFGAKYLIFVMLVIVLVWFLRQPRTTQKHAIVAGILLSVIALVLSRVASALYFDPRPFVTGHVVPLLPHAADNGFPSDHALLGAAVALTLWHFDRRVGAFLLLLAALVGAARVAAHVHHAVDILGSFGIATLAAMLTFIVILPALKRPRASQEAVTK